MKLLDTSRRGVTDLLPCGGIISKKWRKSACKPGSVLDSHSSGSYVTIRLKQPTRIRCGSHPVDPYLVLLQVGFTLPLLLPTARCALTTPFHPYLSHTAAGGIISVALAIDSRRPGVTWHLHPVEPGLSSITRQASSQRLSGQLPPGGIVFISATKCKRNRQQKYRQQFPLALC